jgi:uncharacterized protein (DUF58 family)
MVGAGAVFGIKELFAVAAATAVVLIAAVTWTRVGRWDVVSERQLHSLRAGVGEDVVVGIRLTNQSPYPSPSMRLRDPVELGSGSVELAVGPIDPGESVRGSYRLRARTRGVFRLGPLSMYATDPFGLAQRVQVAPVASTVIIHPRVEPLRFATATSGLDRRSAGSLPTTGHDNDEFASLREYRPGDDLRRLHWASTARADTLMVREDQVQHRAQLTVLVDLRALTWTPSTLERGLSAAASVALASLGAGLSVRLVTTAGTDTGAASGTDHGARILDDLAAAEVHHGHPFPVHNRGSSRLATQTGEADGLRAGHRGPRGSTDRTDTLVVVGGEGTAGALRLRRGIGRNATVVHIVIEGAGRSDLSGRSAGQVVRVGPGGLAAAWNQVAP